MKRTFIITAAILFLSAPVLAQQTVSAPEVALQINSMVGAMAQAVMNQGKQIEELQKQIAAKDARIKELETKAGAKKD